MSSNRHELSISVALATYNGDQFLQHQLDSIASQTILPMELVICDDGSSDQTINVIEEFKKCVPFPVKLFINDINLGSSKNFEKAIFLCAGNVVVLSDQDDIWRSDRLAHVVDNFMAEPEAVGVFSNAELIDALGNSLNDSLWSVLGLNKYEKCNLSKGGHAAFKVLLKRSIFTGMAFAFRRDAFTESYSPIPDDWVHDAWIAINIVRMGSIVFSPEKLIEYRQHETNQIGMKRSSLNARLKQSTALDEALGQLESLRSVLLNKRVSLEYINSVESKIDHLNCRQKGYARPFFLVRELFRGNYRKYSSGIKSFFKDLYVWAGCMF